jgi:hypothetical protein
MDSEILLLPHDEFEYYNNDEERDQVLEWLENTLTMLGERRLTTDLDGNPIGTHIDPMHRENIKRIKLAYRHPFERIPDEYFHIQREGSQVKVS